jgi:O-antigen/teichoic acid export membrane protein/GT2 family glycosyltransferase
VGALIGLLAVFVVPASALQVAVTREVAHRRSKTHEEMEDVPLVIGPLLMQSLAVGVVAALLLLAVSPELAHFLHLPDSRATNMLALYMVPVAVGIVPRAVLVGELRFKLLAFSLFLSSVVRLALAGPLTHRSGVAGALAATVIGELVAIAVLLPFVRQFTQHRPDVQPLRVHWSDGTAAIVAFSGFWAFCAIHPVLARHYLGGVDSGYYVAASTLAQSSLFLASITATVAFPRFAASKDDDVQLRKLVVQAMVFSGIAGVGAAMVLAIASKFIITLVYGEGYDPSASLLGIMAIGSAALGCVFVLMHFHLARLSRMAASFSWFSVVIGVVGVMLFHKTMHEVAVAVVVASVVTLVLMLQPALKIAKRPDMGIEDEGLWDAAASNDMDFTMVVPYYNPGAAVRQQVESLSAVLASTDLRYEIIAVSDGSTDGSERYLESLVDTNVRSVRLEKNSGKGAALRAGLLLGRGKYLGFIDADGDIDPELIRPYIELIRLYEPDIILGSKRHPMSDVQYPPLRVVYSWGYQQLVHMLFHLRGVRDTQTGLKLVRREALVEILPRMLEKRFAFDLELLVVARLLGYRKIFEAPIRITHQFTSTVSWRSVYGTLLDTCTIWYRLHILRFYDRSYRQNSAELTHRQMQNVSDQPPKETQTP